MAARAPRLTYPTAEFVTLSQIAEQEHTLPKHAVARFVRRGVHPIDLPARCSKLYRRADLRFR